MIPSDPKIVDAMMKRAEANIEAGDWLPIEQFSEGAVSDVLSRVGKTVLPAPKVETERRS